MVGKIKPALRYSILFTSMVASMFLHADVDQMIEEIKKTAKELASYTKVSSISDEVINALKKVDRSKFVPEKLEQEAFGDTPLPIGHGQTISQPYIVALMTEVLDVKTSDKVLEIGTGSGYQAAVLAELAQQIYTIEIVSELAQQATAKLETLGYKNVEVRDGDGWFGWPEKGPFDKIIVTATAEEIPPDLIEQLKPGGLLVMPVGEWTGAQTLTLLSKSEDGESFTTKSILPVRFVPLTGDGVLLLDEKEEDSE